MTPPPRDSAGSIPEVFTLDEAAEILRVKRSWLEKKAAARRIPFSLLGGSYHFSPDHLCRIFQTFEEKPATLTKPTPPPAPAVRRARRGPVETADPRIVPLRPRRRGSRQPSKVAA